jgi:membrane protease YdiL (CAAX protease family)
MKKIKTLLFSTVPLLLGIGIQYVAMIYLIIISAIFMFVIAPQITQTSYNENDFMVLLMNIDFNTILMIAFSVTCIVIFGIWYYKSCGGNFLPNVKRTFHPLQFLGIVFLIPGTQFFSSIIIGIVSSIFPSWLEAYEKLLESAGMGDEISIIMMIYSVCLAPIGEELIFRGVTMRIARRSFPFWAANLIQAVLFGIFHMNMIQGIYAAVLGLFLGYVCEKGGSIYLAIVFHFLFNLWGTTSAEWLTVEDPMLISLIVIGGTIIGLVAGILFFRRGNSLVGRAAAKAQ